MTNCTAFTTAVVVAIEEGDDKGGRTVGKEDLGCSEKRIPVMDRMVRRTARGKDGRSWIQAFCRSFEFAPPESTIGFVGPAIYPLARPLSRFSTTVHRKDGGKESGSLLTDLSVVPPPLAFRLAMFEARATLNSTRLPICPAEISATVARPFATSCWIVEAGKESNSFIDLDFVSSPVYPFIVPLAPTSRHISDPSTHRDSICLPTYLPEINMTVSHPFTTSCWKEVGKQSNSLGPPNLNVSVAPLARISRLRSRRTRKGPRPSTLRISSRNSSMRISGRDHHGPLAASRSPRWMMVHPSGYDETSRFHHAPATERSGCRRKFCIIIEGDDDDDDDDLREFSSEMI
jgi:hypothetical protein